MKFFWALLGRCRKSYLLLQILSLFYFLASCGCLYPLRRQKIKCLKIFVKAQFAAVSLSLILLNSCVPKDAINDGFEEKYSEAIESLKAKRVENEGGNKQNFFSMAPTTAEIEGQRVQYYSYSDISKFGQKTDANAATSSENYYPANAAPQGAEGGIFEIRYSLDSQAFFRRPGLEFDNIAIPEYDAYGVKTAMSEKNYFLPGGNLLQRSIDKVIDSKSEFDDENAEILVKEKKQILRKKLMRQIFDGNVELAKNDEPEQNSEEEAKKSAKKDDKKNQQKAENLPKINNNDTSGFTIRAAK